MQTLESLYFLVKATVKFRDIEVSKILNAIKVELFEGSCLWEE